MTKKFLIFTLVAILVAVGVAYYMYNKPHMNVAKTSPDFTLSADSLFAEYQLNEQAANTKFLEKILLVNGTVDHPNFENPAEPNIVLIASDGEGTVTCGFKPEYLASIQKLIAGDKITIKGQCKGLTGDAALDLLASPDVVLTNCTVVADNK
jgi:hypothetical protein